MVGKTFSCLNARQFRALRDGDRFFFAHEAGAGPANPRPFTDAQLSALRRRRLSDLLCDNTDIRSLPSEAFRFGSEEVCCGDGDGVNRLDLSLFFDVP